MAATVLLKLSLFSQQQSYWDLAENSLAALAATTKLYPNAFAQWLIAACLYLSEPKEIAIVGELHQQDTKELIDIINSTYHPELVIAVGDEKSNPQIPLLLDRTIINQKATAYVCRRFICREPTNSPEKLKILLNS